MPVLEQPLRHALKHRIKHVARGAQKRETGHGAGKLQTIARLQQAAGQAGPLARQFVERGLDKSGIKVIGPGDVMDCDMQYIGSMRVDVRAAEVYTSNSHASEVLVG